MKTRLLTTFLLTLLTSIVTGGPVNNGKLDWAAFLGPE